MLLNGEWVSKRAVLPIVNPATEHIEAEVPIANSQDVQLALQSAKDAQVTWSRRTGVDRGDILRRWAALIEKNRDRLAELITREVGKPLHESQGEIDLTLAWINYFAGFDRRIEGQMLSADKPDEHLWIIPSPVGVVVGIIPWNYPLGVAMRKIAPALIAGNAIVLKPHEETPLAALAAVRLGREAGVPDGVVNVVTGPGETVGDALVSHDIPNLVTFTGSVATGQHIMRRAAEHVTSISLEMGGKAPFIVMDDVDLESTVQAAVQSRFMNCGQVCICNERTLVHRSIFDAFVEWFVEQTRNLTVGDPLNAGTAVGPKKNKRELLNVEKAVEQARSEGARLLCGGRRINGNGFSKGFWYEPTVLVGVNNNMSIVQDEIFGPVIPIAPFDTFEEALTLANDTRYGLAAYLYTKDVNRIMRAIRDFDCGELYINRGPGESVHGYHTGWKRSGIGGDDGTHGLNHYLRRKTVYLRYTS